MHTEYKCGRSDLEEAHSSFLLIAIPTYTLLRIQFKLWGRGLQELRGHTRDGIVVRTPLERGENGKVNFVFKPKFLVFAEEDQSRPWASQTLVRRGCDNVGVFEGVVHYVGGNETTDVCHVHQQVSTNAVCDLAKARIVPLSGVSRGTSDEDLRLEDCSLGFKLVVVN